MCENCDRLAAQLAEAERERDAQRVRGNVHQVSAGDWQRKWQETAAQLTEAQGQIARLRAMLVESGYDEHVITELLAATAPQEPTP